MNLFLFHNLTPLSRNNSSYSNHHQPAWGDWSISIMPVMNHRIVFIRFGDDLGMIERWAVLYIWTPDSIWWYICFLKSSSIMCLLNWLTAVWCTALNPCGPPVTGFQQPAKEDKCVKVFISFGLTRNRSAVGTWNKCAKNGINALGSYHCWSSLSSSRSENQSAELRDGNHKSCSLRLRLIRVLNSLREEPVGDLARGTNSRALDNCVGKT